MAAIEIKPARSNLLVASLFYMERFYLCGEKFNSVARPIKSNEALCNNKSLECMLNSELWYLIGDWNFFARRRTVNRPVNGYQFCLQPICCCCVVLFPLLVNSVTRLRTSMLSFVSFITNDPASQPPFAAAPLRYLHFSRIKITIAKYLAHDFFVNIFRSNAATVSTDR